MAIQEIRPQTANSSPEEDNFIHRAKIDETQHEYVENGVTFHADGGPPQNPDDATRAYFNAQALKRHAQLESERLGDAQKMQVDILAAAMRQNSEQRGSADKERIESLERQVQELLALARAQGQGARVAPVPTEGGDAPAATPPTDNPIPTASTTSPQTPQAKASIAPTSRR